MATTYEAKAILRTETAGSVVEGAAGIAVVILAIIGLARGDTGYFTSIGVIVLGAAMLIFGATIASEYGKLLAVTNDGTIGAADIGTGMTVEILAGGSAIILGILGLIGLSPGDLLPAAVITVAVALIFSASNFQRLNALKSQASGMGEIALSVSRAAMMGAMATQVLTGLAAAILGILALSTTNTALLTQVGMLVLGVSLAFSGTALTGRMVRLFNHT